MYSPALITLVMTVSNVEKPGPVENQLDVVSFNVALPVPLS